MEPSAILVKYFIVNAQWRLCGLWSSDDVFTAAVFCAVRLESPRSLFLSVPCRQTGFHGRLALPLVLLI